MSIYLVRDLCHETMFFLDCFDPPITLEPPTKACQQLHHRLIEFSILSRESLGHVRLK